jgi:hypothetical protein
MPWLSRVLPIGGAGYRIFQLEHMHMGVNRIMPPSVCIPEADFSQAETEKLREYG